MRWDEKRVRQEKKLNFIFFFFFIAIEIYSWQRRGMMTIKEKHGKDFYRVIVNTATFAIKLKGMKIENNYLTKRLTKPYYSLKY